MTKDELKEIEKLIEKHKPSSASDSTISVLFILFLLGFFKGCGY